MVSLTQLNALFEADTSEKWSAQLFAIISEYDFDHVLFGLAPAKQITLDSSLIVSNYPSQWRSRYDAEYLHQIDPTVSHCLRSSVPVIWSPGLFKNAAQQAFYEEARKYGLRHGLSFPIHGSKGEFGMLSFVNHDAEQKTGMLTKPEILSDMALIRDYAFESSIRFLPKKNNKKGLFPKLTSRELECLKWTTEGKTSWETSVILGCSESTVNFHISNIKEKFGVHTRQQAAVKAISLGLVTPG
jgi:LuxR family quorum-sensing transcriptional regulator LasR